MHTLSRRKAIQLVVSAFPLFLLRGSIYAAPERTASSSSLDELMAAIMWNDDPESSKPDSYTAFWGAFRTTASTELRIIHFGASWYVLWVDGKYLTEGPPRFNAAHPEFQSTTYTLEPGLHHIYSLVHYDGVATRMMKDFPPFLLCLVTSDEGPVAIDWRCCHLPHYASQTRRINPELGWSETSTSQGVPDWRGVDRDELSWKKAVRVAPKIGGLKPCSTAEVRSYSKPLSPMQKGVFSETFGYAKDDAPARFYLRDLAPAPDMIQGVWRRYDLGKVLLGRPEFAVVAPKGSTIEFAYSEQLIDGRTNPWITLSDGASCNMDRYSSRGGLQRVSPITPRGGRFVEVHVSGSPADIQFIEESYLVREYFHEPEGSFACGDRALEAVWLAGVNTLRSCSEDAVIDNPTRERGQWTGDLSVALEVSSCAYNDLSLIKRGLQQAAQAASPDGMVSSLSPGDPLYFPSYAAQWGASLFRHFQLTGERLPELASAGRKNFELFASHLDENDLVAKLEPGFIDWGYVPRGVGVADPALNLSILRAVRGLEQWSEALDLSQDATFYSHFRSKLEGGVRRLVLTGVKSDWQVLGYHATCLSLDLDLLDASAERSAIAFIKRHLLACFPNNVDAPRLSSPEVASAQLITPYFAHFAFTPLIERGEMDFVLEQYRTAWGWMLKQNPHTLLEVFDTRWSHCHQWSACPTWQLSRFVLGLHPREDLGLNHFDLRLRPGSLLRGQGTLPCARGGSIQVHWERLEGRLHYQLTSARPLTLHLEPTGKETGQVHFVPQHFESQFDL